MRAENRKGGLCDKPTKLHPETVDILRRIVMPQREVVFFWPWEAHSLWGVYKGILRAAGLPWDQYHSFHCLRKSVASWTKASGGNAQQVLGHYDPRMTEEVYIDPRIAPNQQAADVLFFPGSKGGKGNVPKTGT
jgi:integrase